MTEAKTYTGGCHCGKVRYEVETALAPAIGCNCSICSKTGTLLAFVDSGKFKLLSGEADLSDYQFNKHHVHHVFCRHCGIRSFVHGSAGEGKVTYGINLRCLDGVDPDRLEVTRYDGKSL